MLISIIKNKKKLSKRFFGGGGGRRRGYHCSLENAKTIINFIIKNLQTELVINVNGAIAITK